MSTLIYKAPVRTGLGPGEVRITDTAPDGSTPSLRTVPPKGELRLQQGNTATAETDLPTTIGSFFDLRFSDTRSRAFQRLFRTVFAETRFEVELDLPRRMGTWYGYVKSTLQSRRLTRRTGPGEVRITCFDRMAALGADGTSINARSRDVRQFLVEAFAQANPTLPIAFYTDLTAETIEGDVVGPEKWRPIAGNARSYEPPAPNGPSGEQRETGLEGSSLRAQLDDLCGRLGAVAYQDIRLGAWAVVDFAAIGAPVTGARYDGSSWSSYTFPEHTESVGELPGGKAVDTEDALKTQESVKAVRFEIGNWMTDPGFEATLNGSDFEYYTTKNGHWERNSDGYAASTASNASTDNELRQEVDLTQFDIKGQVDVISLKFESNTDADTGLTLNTGVYLDGFGGLATDRIEGAGDDGSFSIFFDVDSLLTDASATSFGVIGVGFSDTVSGDVIIETVQLQLLRKLTDNPVDDFGLNNKYERIETVSYTSGEKGRTSIESDAGGFLTVLTDGSEVPAQEWRSDRYSSSPYIRLSRWRAINLLAVRPPPHERLETTVVDALVPLGTRVEARKPGAAAHTSFVPLKGRVVHLAGDEGTSTELKDVEIPDAVITLI